MNDATGYPETLLEAVTYFAEGDNALNFVADLRWKQGPVCPCCGSHNVRFLESRKIWECRTKHAKRQFSVKVGTIFEDSPIKLDKWLCTMWMLANCKNGVSSYEISREIGVTQKTGWFMLQRIRLAMQTGSIEKMEGIVEADETYIGGKARNMHAAKREKGIGTKSMTPVQGLLERGTREKVSRIKLRVIKDTTKVEIQKDVREYVLKGTHVYTDSLHGYKGLADEFTHKFVDHAVQYVKGNVHTNGLENFWSLLKRGLKGTYVSVEPFHLFRYLDEQAFRYNERKDDNHGRFLNVVGGIFGRRLTYKKLIGKDGEQGDRLALA
ncbi:MAG: IS1595 family transposase [Verrucomicrobiota bacterium]